MAAGRSAQPVDVLAVMEVARRHLNGGHETPKPMDFAAACLAMPKAIAAVAELVEALQEIHYFTREHRRCESDRVRWIAERAERAVRQAGAEPQSRAALARMEPQS